MNPIFCSSRGSQGPPPAKPFLECDRAKSIPMQGMWRGVCRAPVCSGDPDPLRVGKCQTANNRRRFAPASRNSPRPLLLGMLTRACAHGYGLGTSLGTAQGLPCLVVALLALRTRTRDEALAANGVFSSLLRVPAFGGRQVRATCCDSHDPRRCTAPERRNRT